MFLKKIRLPKPMSWSSMRRHRGDYPFAITMSFPVLILLIVLKNGIHTVAGLSINMMKLIMRHFAIMVCRRLSFLSRLAMGKELIKIK